MSTAEPGRAGAAGPAARLIAAQARRAPGAVSLTVLLSLLTSGLRLAAAGIAALALQSMIAGVGVPTGPLSIAGPAEVAIAGGAVFALFILAAASGYAARAAVVRAMRRAFERLMHEAAAAVKARMSVPGARLPASFSTAGVLNGDCRYAAMTFAAALNALPGLLTALAGCAVLAVIDARVLLLVIACAAIAAPVQLAAARRADAATRDLLSASGPSTRARAGLMQTLTAAGPGGDREEETRLAAEISSGETQRFLDAMERRQMVTERADFIALVARGAFATAFIVGLGALAASGEVALSSVLPLLVIGGVAMASLGAAAGVLVYAAALIPLFAPLARLLHGSRGEEAEIEPDDRLAHAAVCGVFTTRPLDWFLASSIASRTASKGARAVLATGFEAGSSERGRWAGMAEGWRARLADALAPQRRAWLDALCSAAGEAEEGPAERVLARALALSPEAGDAVILDGNGFARLAPAEKRLLIGEIAPAKLRLVFRNAPTHAGLPDEAPIVVLHLDDTLDVLGSGGEYHTQRAALSDALARTPSNRLGAELD